MNRLFPVILLGLGLASFAAAQEAAPKPGPTAEAAAPDLQPLIDALQDEGTRARLIEALEAEAAVQGPPTEAAVDAGVSAAGGTPVAESAPTDEPGPVVPQTQAPTELQSLARRTAEATQDFVNEARARAVALSRDLDRLRSLPEVLTVERRARILAEAPLLLITIVGTVVVYRIARILARRIVTPPPAGAQLHTVGLSLVAQALLRAFGILLAWITGYAIALGFGGGEVALVQALYLNGFLVSSAVIFVLSVFVSHNKGDVTLSDLPRKVERAIFRSIKRVSAFLIYGIVTIVPITQAWSNFVIARSARSLILTVGAILALLAIRRIARALRNNRAAEEVTDTERDPDENLSDLVSTTTESLWQRLWPPLAVAYVLTAYWVAITRPNMMTEFLGRATAFTVLGLAILIVSLRVLSASGRIALHLPNALKLRLPTLEGRLNQFVPMLCVAAGLAGIVGAVTAVAEGWDLVALQVTDSTLLWRIGGAALILAATLTFWAILSAWIDIRLSPSDPSKAPSARSRTLLSLLRNALTIALLVFGLINALAELGINIAPLLAGAGVIGLAIGFGAQKLVQDIITGVFIQLENAINEGDVITVAGITGAVESLTIRSVGIRDLSGVYHLIPFSAVDTVSNFMRGYGYHLENLGVAYDSDLDQVRAAMFAAFDKVRNSHHGMNMIGPLDMHGVVSLGDSAVVVRARVKTRPGQQWAVGRAYTEAVKVELDARGIEIPFPHREIKLPPELLEQWRGRDRLPAAPSSKAADAGPDSPAESGADAQAAQ